VLSPRHRAEVSRAAGWIAPVVVHGGRIVATWEDEDTGPAWFAGERVPSPAALRAARERRPGPTGG
jgi:hypothetical protein